MPGSIIPANNPTTPSAPPSVEGLVPVADPASPSPDPASPPQASVAVYETYSWQLAANYSFFRFNEAPGVRESMNGLIIQANYYFLDWLAAEGEFFGEFGSQSGFNSRFAFGGGGPRFRWSLPRNVELFGHTLLGHAHFTPQTPFGGQGAFAYVLGGGLDVNAHHRRFAYRVGADMVASRFFGTNQFSPRVYVGFVFKF